MEDTIIEKERKLCVCCMKEHEVLTIQTKDVNIFKGVEVEYNAIYNYCSNTDEYIETEDMMTINDAEMKKQYRRKINQ